MNLDLRSYVVRVENFSLVGKRRTTGSTDKCCVFCSACTNAVKLQMPLPTTSREKDSFAAFVRRLKSIILALNNDPRMVQSHCSDFLRF